MNKNEFAENLVKEFSVKHPNYSASVKKPEEEPVTDDVCAMFQKNRTVILVHMDAAFEDYCQYGIEVVLQKIDNSLTYCEKNGKKGEELVDTLDCYESIKDRLFIRAFNCETGRKKMENGVCRRTVGGVTLVLYVFLETTDGKVGSIMIPAKATYKWEKSYDEVFSAAMENTLKLFPPRITDMGTLLFKSYSSGKPFMENDFHAETDFLILISENKLFGATAIFFPKVAERISQIMGGDYYFTATCVHEGFVHKINMISPKNIKEGWNASTDAGISDGSLTSADFLSDRVFRYDSRKKEIVTVL